MTSTQFTFTCDRCGATEISGKCSPIIGLHKITFFKEVSVSSLREETMDLCLTCNKSLNRWLKEVTNDE